MARQSNKATAAASSQRTVPAATSNGAYVPIKKPNTLARTLAALQQVNPKCGDEGVSLSTTNTAEDQPKPMNLKPGEIAYDIRHSLYNGEWELSLPKVHNELAQDDMDEPHLKRKHAILDVHPEIKNLYGIDWRTKYVIIVTTSIQVAAAYAFGKGLLRDCHWALFLAVTYFLGASITALFGVLIHETTHNLAAKNPLHNRLLGFICNIGILFPISASFRRYHLEHHAFQGVHGRDPDLPFELEWKLVRNSKILKFIWVFCFPIMYVVRGAALMKTPQTWELMNWVWTIGCDVSIYYFCGPRGLLYLFLSLWFGYGIHVGAAHFIQEHYTFVPGQETYSYYGSLNKPYMNIGFHNEHHDFTQVPWSRLPKIRSIAGEFYNTLAYHTSWVKVLYDFICCDHIGPQSRVGRTFEDHKAARATVHIARKLKSS